LLLRACWRSRCVVHRAAADIDQLRPDRRSDVGDTNVRFRCTARALQSAMHCETEEQLTEQACAHFIVCWWHLRVAADTVLEITGEAQAGGGGGFLGCSTVRSLGPASRFELAPPVRIMTREAPSNTWRSAFEVQRTRSSASAAFFFFFFFGGRSVLLASRTQHIAGGCGLLSSTRDRVPRRHAAEITSRERCVGCRIAPDCESRATAARISRMGEPRARTSSPVRPHMPASWPRYDPARIGSCRQPLDALASVLATTSTPMSTRRHNLDTNPAGDLT